MVELGFDPAREVISWHVKERLDAMAATIDLWMLRQMKATASKMIETADQLERMRVGRESSDSGDEAEVAAASNA